MLKFPKYQAAQLLGLTPLARTPVTDKQIFELLLSPTVKAMLGPIQSYGEPQLLETTAGHFPGDESSNLNGHLIAGVENGVRYPYLSVCHRSAHGALVIKRDLRKLKVSVWVGDIDKGTAEQIFMVALRDRHLDGTKQANDTALLSFPYDAACNKPLTTELSSLEISIYSSSPGSRIKDESGDIELDRFVEKPFSFREQPELFLKLFKKAWQSSRAPGQHAAAIKDVAKSLMPGIEKIAAACNYDVLEAAPSHYHVLMWFLASGYKVSYKHDLETIEAIKNSLARIEADGHLLTRSQQSWVCVLQSLRPDLIPAHLSTGIIWPQDNIGPESLWVAKPLSRKARQLKLPLPA